MTAHSSQLTKFPRLSPTENSLVNETVSLVKPWSDTRETLLPTVLQLLRHCWRGHVIPPHSCVIQVFIATNEARRCDATRCATRHGSARLGSAQRKHRFVYCCVIAGTCFDVTVLAWRKYATLYTPIYIIWAAGIRFSGGETNFSILHSIQISPGAYTDLYPMGCVLGALYPSVNG
jgi:hypothetical protein